MPVCRFLPHGLYSLIPTVLASIALMAGHARDACRYAVLTEGILVDFLKVATTVDTTTTENDTKHYLEVGLNAYWIPDSLLRDDIKFRQCFRYPDMVTIDPTWHVAKAASFISVVLGGGAVFYLWISTCCRFNKSSWRCAAYEILLAMVFQMIAFVWFRSDICRLNTCQMGVGSKLDVAAVVIWLLAAVSILVYYPKPPEITLGDGLMAPDDLRLDEENNNNIERDSTAATPTEAPKDDAAGDVEMTTGESSGQEPRKGLDDVQLT